MTPEPATTPEPIQPDSTNVEKPKLRRGLYWTLIVSYIVVTLISLGFGISAVIGEDTDMPLALGYFGLSIACISFAFAAAVFYSDATATHFERDKYTQLEADIKKIAARIPDENQ